MNPKSQSSIMKKRTRKKAGSVPLEVWASLDCNEEYHFYRYESDAARGYGTPIRLSLDAASKEGK